MFSKTEFKASVVKEMGSYEDAVRKQDFRLATDLIRAYVSRHILWSDDGLNINVFAKNGLEELPVEQIQFYFDSKEIGVTASGAALFLQKLYQLFGFDAATYEYGIPGICQHAHTLVLIPDKNGVVIVAQDPVFNLSYAVPNNENRNFVDVLDSLSRGKANEIRVLQFPVREKNVSLLNDDNGRATMHKYIEEGLLNGTTVGNESGLTSTQIISAKADLSFSESYLKRFGSAIYSTLATQMDKPATECNPLELIIFNLRRTQFKDDNFNRALDESVNRMQLTLMRPVDKSGKRFRLKMELPQPAEYTPPPDPTGWVREWHGYYLLEKAIRGHIPGGWLPAQLKLNELNEGVLECFAIYTILEELAGKDINVFELGAGTGVVSLMVSGAIRFNTQNLKPTSARVLAVEAEPNHYGWMTQHMQRQNINATTVFGAIGSRQGNYRFNATADPQANYGQSVNEEKGNIVVPAHSIDSLSEEYGFDHIHLLHMDVQGMEVEALRGASRSLRNGNIDYIIIGTHGLELENQLKQLLFPTHELLIEQPAGQSLKLDYFETKFISLTDGVLVFKRRGI